MKPEIKKRWLKALRSGKYRQAKESLKGKKGGFCCLGVLCDLHAKETGHKWKSDNSYLRSDNFLPKTVMRWAGLESSDPGINDSTSLSEANDSGKRFSTIANLIEKHL